MDAYLASRSGPERLGKRLEAAKCRRHTAPRGGTPAAGLQGTCSSGRSSERPRWHRCRPGGTLDGPRRPHPRLQVPIRPLRAAASHEREAERWRSAGGTAAQCRGPRSGAPPTAGQPIPQPPPSSQSQRAVHCRCLHSTHLTGRGRRAQPKQLQNSETAPQGLSQRVAPCTPLLHLL